MISIKQIADMVEVWIDVQQQSLICILFQAILTRHPALMLMLV